MKRFKLITAVVAAAILIVGVSAALPVQTRPQPTSAQQVSDKYDGDCTGHETAGRCADKCPNGSYPIGYDDETGAAICKKEPTGCPYGDSIPMDMCDKFKPQPKKSAPSKPISERGGK